LSTDYIIEKAAGLKSQNLFIGTTAFGQYGPDTLLTQENQYVPKQAGRFWYEMLIKI
jgi:hypothetical protein